MAAQAKFCAAEHEPNCICDGEVWYGRADSPAFAFAREAPKELFDYMNQFPIAKRDALLEEPTPCDNFFFGDPTPGYMKACMCVPKPKPKIKRCALEGEDCACTGNVFIGALDVEGSKPAKFDQILNLPFFYKENVTNQINCNLKAFIGSDPFAEHAKQCFCDAHGIMDMKEAKAMSDFFMGMMDLEKIEHQVIEVSASADKAAADADKEIEEIQSQEKSEEQKIAEE